jgi:hypothetical protein
VGAFAFLPTRTCIGPSVSIKEYDAYVGQVAHPWRDRLRDPF